MNKQVILAKRPVGLPDVSTWSFVETEIPTLEEGQFLVNIQYISLDPAMRGWINDVRSYIEPVQLGAVMRAGSVGQVAESKHPKFSKGEYVYGHGGAQQYIATDGKGWIKIDASLAPLPLFLGTLGMTGFTSYFGLLNVGEPKEGDVVLVSGGAGAVGSIVGQIAKIKGCKVIGIAGGKEKCDYMIEELGFDGAIDYKNEDVNKAVKRECPKGIDIYFDNVGGEILNIALGRLRRNARVVICGAISQYNNTTAPEGPSKYMNLLVSRSKMEGFVVFDYAKDYGKAALQMATWIKEGKLKSKEDVVVGIDNFHNAFLKLFNGQKMGKLVLDVRT